MPFFGKILFFLTKRPSGTSKYDIESSKFADLKEVLVELKEANDIYSSYKNNKKINKQKIKFEDYFEEQTAKGKSKIPKKNKQKKNNSKKEIKKDQTIETKNKKSVRSSSKKKSEINCNFEPRMTRSQTRLKKKLLIEENKKNEEIKKQNKNQIEEKSKIIIKTPEKKVFKYFN